MKANHPKPSARQGFTLLGIMVAIVIVVALVWISIPQYGRPVARSGQVKAVINARQIALACRLYAQEHDGVFPTGTEPGSASTNANTVLQDLFTAGDIYWEGLLWNPRATHVCADTKPNENGILEPGENAFDYVSGLTDSSQGHLPLIIEAQTSPHTWDPKDGHPWDREVVVASVDGSTRVVNTERKTNRIRVEHPSGEVDLLSVNDEAGTTPGHLPPEAVVNRAAPVNPPTTSP